MQLQDIIKSLDKIGKNLAKVETQQSILDAQAKKYGQRLKESASSTDLIVANLRKSLIGSVVLKFSKLAESLTKHARLTAELPGLMAEYSKSLYTAQNAWQKLTDAQVRYEHAVRIADTHQNVLAKKLISLHESADKAQTKRQYAVAATLKRQFALDYAAASDQSKRVFNAYRQTVLQGKEAEKLGKQAARLGQEHKQMSVLLDSITQKNKNWLAVSTKVTEVVKTTFNSAWFLIASAGTSLITQAFHEVGRATIDANGGLQERLKLTKANAKVNLAIGAGTAKIAAAQKALISTGQKDLATNVARVKTVVMMKSALGIAEEDSANLALQADLTGNSFERAADAVAKLVSRTQLTAKEAMKTATSMAQLHRELDLKGNLVPVTEAVGTMDSALKKLGGTEGLATKLIERFSTLKGIGDAVQFGGVNGIVNPEDFNNVTKLQSMILNTGKELSRRSGGGDPLSLEAQMATIERLGLTRGEARTLINLSKPGEFEKILASIKEGNSVKAETLTLEQRYNEQIEASGQVIDQLVERIKGLIGLALMPLLGMFEKLLEKILAFNMDFAKFIKNLDQISPGLRSAAKDMAWFASTVVGVIFVGTLAKAGIAILRVGRSIIGLIGEITGIKGAAKFIGTNAAKLFPSTVPKLTMAGGAGAAGAAGAAGKKGLLGMLGSKIALPISIAYTLWEALMTQREVNKFNQAHFTEFVTGKNLANIEAQIKKKYNVPDGVNALDYIKKLRESASSANLDTQAGAASMKAISNLANDLDAQTGAASMKAISNLTNDLDFASSQNRFEESAANSAAYQSNVMPLAPITTASGSTIKTAEYKLLEQKFELLAKEMRAMQAAVKTGSESQVKVAEKGIRLDVMQDRLHRENDAVRAKPSTVYGLETYVH